MIALEKRPCTQEEQTSRHVKYMDVWNILSERSIIKPLRDLAARVSDASSKHQPDKEIGEQLKAFKQQLIDILKIREERFDKLKEISNELVRRTDKFHRSQILATCAIKALEFNQIDNLVCPICQNITQRAKEPAEPMQVRRFAIDFVEIEDKNLRVWADKKAEITALLDKDFEAICMTSTPWDAISDDFTEYRPRYRPVVDMVLPTSRDVDRLSIDMIVRPKQPLKMDDERVSKYRNVWGYGRCQYLSTFIDLIKPVQELVATGERERRELCKLLHQLTVIFDWRRFRYEVIMALLSQDTFDICPGQNLPREVQWAFGTVKFIELNCEDDLKDPICRQVVQTAKEGTPIARKFADAFTEIEKSSGRWRFESRRRLIELYEEDFENAEIVVDKLTYSIDKLVTCY